MKLSNAFQKLSKNSEKLKRYYQYAITKITPKKWHEKKMELLLNERFLKASSCEKNRILEIVNYYNKVNNKFSIDQKTPIYQAARLKKEGSWFYHYDLTMQLAAFSGDLLFHYLPGDVQSIPSAPTLVKSRPISDANENSILLKLNTIRHFNFVKDPFQYADKKDVLVWRGACYQTHRRYFIENFHSHPLCNVGDTSRDADLGKKPFMSIHEQLTYKFILSIEGNEVASNLKWIMASNSLCFMVKPKFETWFMEGTLTPGIHYVELKEDYSDLDEKINFYLENEDDAITIIKNANDYVKPFLDHDREALISHLVLQKYFLDSGQYSKINHLISIDSYIKNECL
ncbi:lipopolysaccharide A protein [Vreelandella andesensis]|uniref:Lipopolysaccharide A protein n=1 Tax=Vreelandella andesensis TaxID=447567 RepID=A0A433KKL6_9GAMM|nr:glycosyl transferase family 90 [Halomonas andesensis]RUR30084.1 lipopolysaccharide A protein [Halomonas andesensis]